MVSASFGRHWWLVVADCRRGSVVPGRGFEPLYSGPKPDVLPLNDPGVNRLHGCAYFQGSVVARMGSLVKRRRKRMRKKKHKKMLRRTRHQRNSK